MLPPAGSGPTRARRLLLATLVSLAAAACVEGAGPSIEIRSPAAGSSHSLGKSAKVALKVSVLDFQLKPVGACRGEADCGQIHLTIDDKLCNVTGRSYNAILGEAGAGGSEVEIEADFSLCEPAAQIGTHTVAVSLHKEDGSIVSGLIGPARATVSLVTTP